MNNNLKNNDPRITVGVIGAGVMGSGIAQVASYGGENVFLYDINPDSVETAISNIQKSFKKLIDKRRVSEHEADEALSRIKPVNTIELLADCNIIIEAIIENIDVKKEVFKKLEKISDKNCLLTSNTSSLSIASIASTCNQSERVIGLHFFNPPAVMKLVEIIPTDESNPSTVNHLKKLMEKWGKVPVIAKDTPGFIVNRVARPFYGEALRLYDEGIADCATIDWAMKEFGGFKMGPFELMDFIGIDVNYTVTKSVWEQFFYDPKFKPSHTQKRLFEGKYYGRKSGKGFYNYSAPMPEPVKNIKIGEYIFRRILTMLINEAADMVYYGVASVEDIDIAVENGLNYPKGLFKWADEKNAEYYLNEMKNLYSKYLEERYRPSPQFKKMIKENRYNFY